MEGPKAAPNQKKEPAPEQPAAVEKLDSVRTSGNKLELLEALLIEGKLNRMPYAGPQALRTEGDVTPQEIITGAVTGAQSSEIEAARALDPKQRTTLMERVLEERPNLTSTELRAACEMLDIDPDPFLKRMTEIKTEKLHETIEQSRKEQRIEQVVLRLEYESRHDLGPIFERYKEQQGQTIQERLEQSVTTPREQATLQLALLGRPQSALEEVERIEAAVTFERSERQRYRFLFVSPDHVHLDSAEDQLDEAREMLRGDDLFEDDEDDRFKALLGNARDSLRQYHEEVPAYGRDPAVLLGTILAILCIGAIVAIEISLGRNYILATTVLGIGTFATYRIRQTSHPQFDGVTAVKKKYLTASQIRGLEKSRRLRARLDS